MPKDNPSAYSPQEVAQELLSMDNADAIVNRLDELGWELAPSGQPAEEGIGDMGDGGDDPVSSEEEIDMAEEEGDSDVPMPMGPKPPYLTVLRMSAVDKAFDKDKKKKDKGEKEEEMYV